MNELALFAGAGGGLLASTLLGWRTVCAVEIEPYCRRVLMQRQNEGVLEPFPIWDDVRTFDGTSWRGKVDVVSAGFPCQPFSQAGKRRGADDERNMWPATARILGEVRPRFALLENVPALITSGYFGTILGDLAEVGFDARWGVFSAAGSGAPHLRKRLFIVAFSNTLRTDSEPRTGRRGVRKSDKELANADSKGLAGRPQGNRQDKATNPKRLRLSIERSHGWWATEPAVGRVALGVANRVDRLKAIGNGQVPSVVVRAWRELSRGLTR